MNFILQAQPHAGHVHRERASKFFLGAIRGALCGAFDAGVVKRAVELPIRFDRLIDEYFDSTNISIDLLGATEPEPHKIYARLLNVSLG